MRRKDGGPCFTFCKKDSSQSLDEDIIDLSEFIETLIGEDEWCGPDIEDKNIIDLTDDHILNELDNLEENSMDKILERWRESVSRQDITFLRRGESKRNKRQRCQDARELKEVAAKSMKITNFYSPTGEVSNSSSTPSFRSNSSLEETMEDLMRAEDVITVDDNDSDDDDDGGGTLATLEIALQNIVD